MEDAFDVGSHFRVNLDDAPTVLADVAVAVGSQIDEPAFLHATRQPFADKVFAFTPALRSWRGCCIGSAKQIPKLMIEWSSRLAFIGRSGDAELFHSAAERVGMEGEELRRAVGALNDPIRLL